MNLSWQGDAFDFDVASHSEKRPAPTPTPGVKGASLRDLYRIKPIPNRSAMRIVVERHYLHRKAPCSNAWGLVDRAGEIQGVVCYGTPSSASLRSGIAGPEHAGNVLELTRLWVDDEVPRNGESYLIGNTLRLNPKEIIVSYAEISAGHYGAIYQATNFLYTGLSAKRTDYHVEGIAKHGQTWGDQFTSAELRATFGDRFSLKPRGRKHRYVFINARGRRRKELIAALRYPIEPYPKAVA